MFSPAYLCKARGGYLLPERERTVRMALEWMKGTQVSGPTKRRLPQRPSPCHKAKSACTEGKPQARRPTTTHCSFSPSLASSPHSGKQGPRPLSWSPPWSPAASLNLCKTRSGPESLRKTAPPPVRCNPPPMDCVPLNKGQQTLLIVSVLSVDLSRRRTKNRLGWGAVGSFPGSSRHDHCSFTLSLENLYLEHTGDSLSLCSLSAKLQWLMCWFPHEYRVQWCGRGRAVGGSKPFPQGGKV